MSRYGLALTGPLHHFSEWLRSLRCHGASLPSWGDRIPVFVAECRAPVCLALLLASKLSGDRRSPQAHLKVSPFLDDPSLTYAVVSPMLVESIPPLEDCNH